MDHHMTDNSEEPPHKKVRGRKKILQGPPYICDYPNCHKEFQRSEHLSRHQLNHNPKKIYECTEPGCTKTFVRHDLLIRHLKRHVNKLAKKGIIQDKTGEKQKLKLKDKLELERQTSDDGYEDHVNTPFVLESTEKALGPVNDGAVNQPLAQPNGQVNMNVSHHGFPPSPGAYTRQQQNASKPFTSVTQILQQHSQSPVVNPGMSEDLNREFTAPNLLNWLFNVNSNVPSSTVSHPDDFLTGLNEFQMNNGGQSFFIPDGLEQVSPSSSSTIGVYQTSERQPTPGGSISETSPQIQQQRRQQSVSINGEIANKQGQINIGSSPVDTAAAQARYDAGKHYDAANPDNESLYRLNEAKLNEFVQLIPEVKGHPDFTKSKLEKSLKMYWKFFHPRFPMLHRPSFNSLETPPLLLLSMIVLGVKLSQCVDDITCPAAEKFQRPKSLADKIALPLRWLLFASPQFQPPATLWIIQSLLMLEFYEKNCTTRQLHERAHLHHGTTIQLLRRSPTLGGSPHKLNSGSDDAGNWFKWIEIESMKRATFMCFYMDAIDAISFGHQMLIYAHQIQMTMPVEDDVWESNLRNFRSSIKKCKRPKPFLIVLKNILNGLPTRTNSFGKKVLLAGLSAIMFQIQQRDMQLMFGLDKFGMTGTVSNWRELLAAAFSIWRNDVGGSCCSSRTAIDNMSSMNNSLQFSTSDTRCKCITYHMAHVYMSISHYDLFIVAGAPWRMNVKPSSPQEREQTEKRVSEWARTRHSEVCIVQCYLLLFETFLSPQDSSYEYQYDYLPDQDLFFRSYVIGLCTMVVWCYVHGRYGKDAFAKTAMTYRNREYEEDGYRYLKRMRNEFTRRSGGIMLHTWFSNCSGAEFYGNLGKWVDVLEDIPDKQNMVGLLELVGNKMVNADYTVVKEIGKLLLFCRDRCRGSNETILRDMYGQ
ncbi:DEKNAAC102370 [Brettanomyces naardenensis]|uniref:DEKNAAC102370 n=1 Tax=Brettanomyces naardenensis TaxID=13370 RepID=A0A448YLD1_BRENA|nr:DEKNAAC102370 [Brettanomyces naardenensis]